MNLSGDFCLESEIYGQEPSQVPPKHQHIVERSIVNKMRNERETILSMSPLA